jgi:hypothetical protein
MAYRGEMCQSQEKQGKINSLVVWQYVSTDEDEETIQIMDDNAIVESVSSPPEEGDDGPEPEHT